MLALVCIAIPLILILFNDLRILESISAYYDMKESQAFYFPLTVAAMMFVVNGVIHEPRVYNVFLGLMLAGLIWFNKNDATILHYFFTVAFFGGNVMVILLFSSVKDLWFKAILVGVVVLVMIGCFVFDWVTLFWAEWVSLSIIALHYWIKSRTSNYEKNMKKKLKQEI